MSRLSVLLVSVVMALTLVAFAVATGASAQQQGEFYSADYDGDTSIWYGDGTSKASAIEAARNNCEAGDTNCAPDVWVNNGYLVVMQGTNEQGDVAYAYSFGHTKKEAKANGMKLCKQPPPYTGCKVFSYHRTPAYDKSMPTKGGAI